MNLTILWALISFDFHSDLPESHANGWTVKFS